MLPGVVGPYRRSWLPFRDMTGRHLLCLTLARCLVPLLPHKNSSPGDVLLCLGLDASGPLLGVVGGVGGVLEDTLWAGGKRRPLFLFPLPGPIPALFITEIFLQSSRPAAYMVGGSVHWLSNFTVGLIFPFIQVSVTPRAPDAPTPQAVNPDSLQERETAPLPQVGLGAYCFIIFAVICLLTTIYIFLVVPETKSKTFIEINQIFTKMNKVSEVHPEKELKDFPPSAVGL